MYAKIKLDIQFDVNGCNNFASFPEQKGWFSERSGTLTQIDPDLGPEVLRTEIALDTHTPEVV